MYKMLWKESSLKNYVPRLIGIEMGNEIADTDSVK